MYMVRNAGGAGCLFLAMQVERDAVAMRDQGYSIGQQVKPSL